MAVKKTTEASAADTVPEKESAGFCAYVGPTVPGVIQSRTIYPGDKDSALERDEVKLAVKAYPGVADLIVDGNELDAALEKIKMRGEALNKSYRAMTKK